MYAADYRWYVHHIADIARDYEGECWTQNHGWITNEQKKIDPAQWNIKTLDSIDKPGLSRKQGMLYRGSNSGYQAIGLAFLMGATRIILVGFDMCMHGTKRHWFGEHPQPLNAASNYNDFANRFATIVPEDYGIEIWNCSRTTALTCFPIYSLDDIGSIR